jgi:RNA polymerase sigma-70 factor (ECF subfamily)
LGVPAYALDDVVQEIFLVVSSRLHTVEQPDRLRSWIFGMVRRTVSNYHRSGQSRAVRGDLHATVGPAGVPTPLEVAVVHDELKLLWRVLSEIDAPKREILCLIEFEEMTIPEVAREIGIPLNTAYSRLRAARQDFVEVYARHVARAQTTARSLRARGSTG